MAYRLMLWLINHCCYHICTVLGTLFRCRSTIGVNRSTWLWDYHAASYPGGASGGLLVFGNAAGSVVRAEEPANVEGEVYIAKAIVLNK